MKTLSERLREEEAKKLDAAQPPKPADCVCSINVDGKHDDGCPRAKRAP